MGTEESLYGTQAKEGEVPVSRHSGRFRVEGGFMASLDGFDRVVFQSLRVVVGFAFSGMLLTVFFAVILREAFDLLEPWIDEIALYLVIWYVFLSVAVLSRRTEHISVVAFHQTMAPSIQRLVNSAIAVVGFALCVYLGYLGLRFTAVAFEQGQTSESGYVPIWIGYLAIPVGLGLTALGYVLALADIFRSKSEVVC